MILENGYHIEKNFYETDSFIFWEGKSKEGKDIFIKEYKLSEKILDMARLQNEIDILSTHRCEYTIELIDFSKGNNFAILEKLNAIPLETFIENRFLSYDEFKKFSLSLVNALIKLHSKNLFHRDINLKNIFIENESFKAKIIDFRLCNSLEIENKLISLNDLNYSDIHFISPEQTGRINRSVDYRTDFYSLGILFYKLLTGIFPFIGNDWIEIVHSHIAAQPKTISLINKKIPESVSNIVNKLLSKTPEGRYQSARGLLDDLEFCFSKKGANQRIPFKPGLNDFSSKFKLSGKLYGRDAERGILLSNLADCYLEKNKILVVTGYSGIGKSSFVNEIQMPLMENGGIFIKGKYEKFKRNIPFNGFINAFHELLNYLLSQPDLVINFWKECIIDGLGSNIGMILDLIPELEKIVGKQPPTKNEPGDESSRFIFALSNFLKALTLTGKPLVIFLDDVQWIDYASLSVLKNISRDYEFKRLMIILAYRDNEKEEINHLNLALEEIRKFRSDLETIILKPLSASDTITFLADSFNRKESEVIELASLIIKRTEGNPFFICEFLRKLHSEKLIEFNSINNSWEWNIHEIYHYKINDNIIDFMLQNMENFEIKTKEILKICSILGNNIELALLVYIFSKDNISILTSLWPAIQTGILIIKENEYDIIGAILKNQPSVLNEKKIKLYFNFTHDRITQTAYSMIPRDEIDEFHWKIGVKMYKYYKNDKLNSKLFDILAHMNHGIKYLKSKHEKIQMIELNLKAGKKAKESIAYQVAEEYLVIAEKLLTNLYSLNNQDIIWNRYYDISINVYKKLAEIYILTGNYEKSLQVIAMVFFRLNTLMEKVEFQILQLIVYFKLSRYHEIIKLGLKTLSSIGFTIPDQENLKIENKKLEDTISNYLDESKLNEFYQNNDMHDLFGILAMNIMTQVVYSVTLSGNIELVLYLTLKRINLSLELGNHPNTSISIAEYAGLLAKRGEYKNSYIWSEFACRLSKKWNYESLFQKSATFHIAAIFSLAWTASFENTESFMEEGLLAGLESGNSTIVEYVLIDKLIFMFYRGNNLSKIAELISNKKTYILLSNNNIAINMLHSMEMIINNFTGKSLGKFIFETEDINEEIYINHCKSQKDYWCLLIFLILKTSALFYYRHFHLAKECAEEALFYNNNFPLHVPLTSLLHYYHALILCNIYAHANEDEKDSIKSKIYSNLNLIKTWADNNKENFYNKYLLIEAEVNRILGEDLKAIDFYYRAIDESEKYNYNMDTALACELYAYFWKEKRNKKVSFLYASEARAFYTKSGALRKSEFISYEFNFEQQEETLDSFQQRKKNLPLADKSLDLASVLKASHAISGEIELSKLMVSMTEIIAENAGAQKGVLIFKRDDGIYYIEVIYSIDKKNKYPDIPFPVKSSREVPQSVIAYVERTGRQKVIEDAFIDPTVKDDYYIKTKEVRSILCLPLQQKSGSNAILYLENNLGPGMFTLERTSVINLIATQAVISLENASLYEKLKNVTDEKSKVQAEMHLAQKIQSYIVPSEPKMIGYKISGYMKSIQDVGGDYYDIINLKDKRFAVIGDVSGHGVTPGLVSMMLQASLHTILRYQPDIPLNRLLSVLNEMLYYNIKSIEDNRYVTLVILKLEDEGKVYFSGEHEEILLYRKETSQTEFIPVKGMWLGIEENIDSHLEEGYFKMEIGDVILLYTDGVTESYKGKHELFGKEKLKSILDRHGHLDTDSIKSKILDELESYTRHDDVSFLVIKRHI